MPRPVMTTWCAQVTPVVVVVVVVVVEPGMPLSVGTCLIKRAYCFKGVYTYRYVSRYECSEIERFDNIEYLFWNRRHNDQRSCDADVQTERRKMYKVNTDMTLQTKHRLP